MVVISVDIEYMSKIESEEVQTSSNVGENLREERDNNERRRNLRGSDYTPRTKSRKTNEPRIITEDDLHFRNQPSNVALRDRVRPVISNDIKRFSRQHHHRIRREKIAELMQTQPKVEELSSIGSMQVLPLAPGSARGIKRPQSLRMRLDYESAKGILHEYRRRYPVNNPARISRTQERIRKREIIAKFGKNPLDTGSTAVQIALKTARIEALRPHFERHRKDLHSKRGFIQLIQDRKVLLKYLRDTRQEEYEYVISELGLRK